MVSVIVLTLSPMVSVIVLILSYMVSVIVLTLSPIVSVIALTLSPMVSVIVLKLSTMVSVIVLTLSPMVSCIGYQIFKTWTSRFNTEGTIKNGQSRETGNIGNTQRRKTKQKHNTICVGQHYTQANTNNVNKIRALLQLVMNNGGLVEVQI
jgi:hypothetical protein